MPNRPREKTIAILNMRNMQSIFTLGNTFQCESPVFAGNRIRNEYRIVLIHKDIG